MTCQTKSRLILPLAMALCCCVLPLVAAPIFEKRQISDEEKAFANIARVQIEITALPRALKDVGLRLKDIRKRVERACRAANIEITDDASVPKLLFQTDVMLDHRFPDAVGYIVFIDLIQKTRIVRLDHELVVPTAVVPVYAIKPKEELAKAVRKSVNDGLMRIMQLIRAAS